MKRVLRKAKRNVEWTLWRAGQAIRNQSGEGFVDTAIKILIAVVIGALLLAGLYSLFDDQIMPTLTRKVNEMFNYGG